MRMIIAHGTMASWRSDNRSWSRTHRLRWEIHESVLSTTHLRGRTTKPLTSSLRLTISRVSWTIGHRIQKREGMSSEWQTEGYVFRSGGGCSVLVASTGVVYEFGLAISVAS